MTHSLPSVPVALSYVPNQMFLMLDDIGPEQISPLDAYNAYTTAYPYASVPWLDFLFKRGVGFTRFYTTDICSPTRTTLLSGQYAFRSGIGTIVDQAPTLNYGPPQGALSLPGLLVDSGIDKVECVGKWHLGNDDNSDSASYLTTPEDAGFLFYSGCLFNVNNGVFPATPGYFNWYHTTTGVTSLSTSYNPSVLADVVITRFGSGSVVNEPFFLYGPANTAHSPLDWPPTALHSYGATATDGGTEPFHFNTRMRAHLESWDTELGRIFQGMDPEVLARTMIYVCGDNGSERLVMQPVVGEPGSPDVTPYDALKFKSTPYEGGQLGWLVVSGPLIEKPGRFVTHYVDSVDLHATFLQVAGITDESRDEWLVANFPHADKSIDGVSIMPHLVSDESTATRAFSLSMSFSPNQAPPVALADMTTAKRIGYRRAADDFKLVRWDSNAADELYDLSVDPLEANDLGTSHAEYNGMREALENLIAS